MIYNIYTLYTNRRTNILCYRNKKKAIEDAKLHALTNKESTIVKAGMTDSISIAICEFPNYLRDLQLDKSDITVVRLDKE